MPINPDLSGLDMEVLQRLMFERNIAMSDAAVKCMPIQTDCLRSIAASLHYHALEREEQRHKETTNDAHRSGQRREAFEQVKMNPPPPEDES